MKMVAGGALRERGEGDIVRERRTINLMASRAFHGAAGRRRIEGGRETDPLSHLNFPTTDELHGQAENEQA